MLRGLSRAVDPVSAPFAWEAGADGRRELVGARVTQCALSRICGACAESLGRPIAFVGDGCFMMTAQELATAVMYGLAVVIIVVNNGMYGTIRMHQEREYPGRVSGSDLFNPDFAALAETFGLAGARVRCTADFEPALLAALNRDCSTVIEIALDPQALTTRASLDEIRARAQAALAAPAAASK